MIPERDAGLNAEIKSFISTDDQIALGNLAIRKAFADRILILFAISNGFVLAGLGIVFGLDCLQLAARQIGPSERIVNSHVIMALLGATTVQLGTVVLTIARAIFPSTETARAKRKGGAKAKRLARRDDDQDLA